MSILVSLRRVGAAVALAALIVGCGGAESNGAAQSSSNANEGPADEDDRAGRKTVMFLGTSLTDGYGLEREQAYPAFIQQKIDSAGLPWEVVNAGLSGEKSAGALDRVRRWLIRQPFDLLVLETGANDMLQGANVDTLRSNIQAIIDTVRGGRPNVPILLVGMRAAPNLGPRYVERFDRTFPELAEKNDLPFIPFLLEGVAGDDELNLADRVHPNERGQRRIAETVWARLQPMLREAGTPPAASP